MPRNVSRLPLSLMEWEMGLQSDVATAPQCSSAHSVHSVHSVHSQSPLGTLSTAYHRLHTSQSYSLGGLCWSMTAWTRS